MGKNRVWVEGTIVAALAMVLSLIPIQIGSSFSISLGQIPLTLFALRRGTKAGCWQVSFGASYIFRWDKFII